MNASRHSIENQQQEIEGDGELHEFESSSYTCGKCKQAEGVFLLRKQNRYCKECLELSLVSKVRGSVRHKRGGVAGGEHVGIFVSGGPSSLCAWYILDRFISSPVDGRREKRKIPFGMHVVHVVDIGEGRKASCVMEYMRQECPVLEEIQAEEVLYPESQGNTSRIAELLETVRDCTGRKDLENILLKRVMLHKARECGWSHIFVGHSADTKAAQAVAAAAKGQGYALSRFSETVESYDGDIGANTKILYCMKDVSLEEVSCLSSSIMGGSVPVETDINRHDIHDLAVHFTTLLQQSNPGGVSNILSSLGKLDVPEPHVPTCPLCLEPLHPDEVPDSSSESHLDALCDSCKVGIFGSASHASLAASDYALDVFSKLPMCIQNDIKEGFYSK